MGEIGSDQGSSYPGALDTNASHEIDAPNPGKTKARKAVVEDLAACIIAIETELGIDPAGSKATVVARLDQEHNADGSHKDTLIVTVSGNNQTVSGRKVFTSGISLAVEGLYGTATGYTPGRSTVGASGAMWIVDDIKTSGSFYATRNPVNNFELVVKQYVDSNFLSSNISLVRAERSGNQSIPNNTSTRVIFNNEIFDTNDEFDSGNGIFTAKVAGYYQISAGIEFDANGTGYRNLEICGSEGSGTRIVTSQYFGDTSATLSTTMNASALKYLSAGNTIAVFAQQNSGAALNVIGSPYTFISIMRIK